MMSNYVCVCSRRRSVLTIARVSKSDAGKYECKAVSVTDEKVCASAHVTVTNEQPPSRLDNSEYICIFKFHLRPFQSAAFWFCALWVTHDAFALSRHRARASAGLWPRARRKSGVAGAENVGRDQVWVRDANCCGCKSWPKHVTRLHAVHYSVLDSLTNQSSNYKRPRFVLKLGRAPKELKPPPEPHGRPFFNFELSRTYYMRQLLCFFMECVIFVPIWR